MSRTTAARRLAGAARAIASRTADNGGGAAATARSGALLQPSPWPVPARGGPASTGLLHCRGAGEARSFTSSSSPLAREAGSEAPPVSAAHVPASAPRPPLPTPAPQPGEAGGVLTYVGPLATTVVRLKRLSLASCCLTTAAAPALAGLQASGAAGTPAGLAAQAGIAAAIAAFGAATTGLVHWFTKPYVLSLAARTADLGGRGGAGVPAATIAVTRMDHFGRRVTVPVRLGSVRPPATGTVHPQVSFADADDGGRLYYVDADHWPTTSAASARLLAALTPADDGVEAVVEGGRGGREAARAPAVAAGKEEAAA